MENKLATLVLASMLAVLTAETKNCENLQIDRHGVNRILVGVDVGGTNTDAVLIQNDRIIACHKTTTTLDITESILQAVDALFEQHENLRNQVESINIGTTHHLNALLETKGLSKPLVIRLAAPPISDALPPTVDWCDRHKGLVRQCVIVKGGYEYNGSEISSLDCDEIQRLANETILDGTEAVAITGLFSPIKPDQEIQTGSIFSEVNPKIGISLSHTLGDLGLLGRENATIVNASLLKLHERVRGAIQRAIEQLNINTRVFLTLGDGTKKRLDTLSSTPLLTINSGPINSVKGAAFLAEVKDAVTVDIGGTSADVGILKNGEPINENSRYELAGIKLNFNSPRFNSFALGGGTVITLDTEGQIKLGPESVGRDLSTKSLAAGGNVLTVTDIAVYLDRFSFGNLHKSVLGKAFSSFSGEDPDEFAKRADEAIHHALCQGIQHILDAIEHVPPHLILVGGGAKLFDLNRLQADRSLQKFTSILIPEEAGVANALGAAHSMIGASYKKVYYLATEKLADAQADAFKEAKRRAILAGAEEESIFLSSVNQIPLSYLPGDPHQISVTAVGRDSGKIGISEPEIPCISSLASFPLHSPSLISRENIIQSSKIKKSALKLKPTRFLTESDINDIAWGAGILGSGGGANPELARLIAVNLIKQGKQVGIISPSDLPDTALTVLYAGMGSPNILSERLITQYEGVNVIRAMEEKIDAEIDAINVLEAGGTNGLYPLCLAAILGKPVVDADCMGRAFPQLQMITPHIYGNVQKTQLAMSNGLSTHIIEENSIPELEQASRQLLVDLGCVVSIAMLPMNGAQVKSQMIPGTISLLQKMGSALNRSQSQPFNMRLEALNEVLKETDYEKAIQVCEGKIDHVHRSEQGGFSIGGFSIRNSEGFFEVGFQNENLIARDKTSGEILAQVPDLITIVDKNTFQVISCEDLRYGLDVVILKLSAPKMLTSERALQVVGPNAFPLQELLDFLDSASK